MLRSLYVQNFILIDKLELEFESGLSVLTGETGAGKSILLDAINLALGGRGDASYLRPGSERALIQLRFELPPTHPFYEKDEFEFSEEGLTIQRIILKSGQSKTYVNDEPVTIARLKEIGKSLIELIGQFSTMRLMERRQHLTFLDQFGNLSDVTQKTKEAYTLWSKLNLQLQHLEEEKERLERDYDYLSSILKELEEIAPQENEESLIHEKKSQFSGAQKAHELLDKTLQKLTDPKSVSGLLYSAQKELGRVPESMEPLLNPLYQQLEKAALEIEDVEAKLKELLAKTNESAKSAELLEDRLHVLRHLARKHRIQPDELWSFWKDTKTKLERHEKTNEDASTLQAQIKTALESYKHVSKQLSAERKKIALELESGVQMELAHLKLNQAKFCIDFQENPEPNICGQDNITFLFAPNPGLPFTPLDETASGGEMSRLLLAFKVLGKETFPRTLIFDEIDTGVGGSVSDAIGLRLQKLSEHTQTIAITHAPQIAAKAHMHYKVVKQISDTTTKSNVIKLDLNAHQEEIARMLSGAEITEEARLAASSLLRSKLVSP